MVLLLFRLFARSADFADYSSDVKVTEARLHRDETSRGGGVTILGHIRNDSAVRWEHPHFEVQCFDHAGNLVDSYATYDSGLVLVPGIDQTFRLTFTPASSPAFWADFKVYLRDARDARSWR